MSDEVFEKNTSTNQLEMSLQTNKYRINHCEMYAGPSNASTTNSVDFYNVSSLTFDTDLVSDPSYETLSNNISTQFRREANANGTCPAKFCPQCKRKLCMDIPLSYCEFYYDMSILLCSNSKCDYPFGMPGEKLSVKYNNSMLEMLKTLPTNGNDASQMEWSQLLDLENVYIKPLLNDLKKLNTDFEKLKRGDYSSDKELTEKTSCDGKEAHEISSSTVTVVEHEPIVMSEEYKADLLMVDSNVSEQENETFVVDTKEDLDYIRELLQHFD